MNLNELIEKYNLCEDDDDKVEIILDDFDELKDKSKWKFLIQLLTNKNTYDLIKVEIYKIIAIEDFNKDEVLKIKNGIIQALINEEDELVKQWGFISLQFNFCNFADVIQICVETIENTEEDEDFRYNALRVIENSENREILEKFKDRLLNINTPKNINSAIIEIFNKDIKYF